MKTICTEAYSAPATLNVVSIVKAGFLAGSGEGGSVIGTLPGETEDNI